MGVLMATGFIVGESLFGVAFAGMVAATDSDAPLALVAENGWAVPLSILAFFGVIAALYGRLRRWASEPLGYGRGGREIGSAPGRKGWVSQSQSRWSPGP